MRLRCSGRTCGSASTGITGAAARKPAIARVRGTDHLLINDDDERAAIEAKVKAADLDNTVFGTGDARYFQKALDYLIENHNRHKGDPDPSPIRIERE